MKSIKSVYKIGNGPSSSHTVGPYHAAQIFGERYPDADLYEVTLYGSLAFTGEGHGTGKAILEGLPGAKIIFDHETLDLPHPNTMRFTAMKGGQVIASVRMFSTGGGSIRIENEASDEDKEVYPQSNFSEIVICSVKHIHTSRFFYIPLRLTQFSSFIASYTPSSKRSHIFLYSSSGSVSRVSPDFIQRATTSPVAL